MPYDLLLNIGHLGEKRKNSYLSQSLQTGSTTQPIMKAKAFSGDGLLQAFPCAFFRFPIYIAAFNVLISLKVSFLLLSTTSYVLLYSTIISCLQASMGLQFPCSSHISQCLPLLFAASVLKISPFSLLATVPISTLH